MRFGAVAENPVEWVVQRMNLAPQPLLDTQMAFTLARAIMEGVRIGAFEALRDGPRTPRQVADACGTEPEATCSSPSSSITSTPSRTASSRGGSRGRCGPMACS
jgi:hypothetical protein